MYFRQFNNSRGLTFIKWKMFGGKLDTGYAKGRGSGWNYLANGSKQTFKLELIL